MKPLKDYIMEDREVKNTKLQKLLKAAGLEAVKLIKDNGYFHITSDDAEMWRKIYALPETDIYVNSFKDMTPEEWVNEIKRLLEQ